MFKHSIQLLTTLLLTLFLNGVAHAKKPIAEPILAEAQNKQTWSFKKKFKVNPLNISGVVVTESFMALATDEGNQLELFQKQGKKWHSIQVITLSKKSGEIDIEGLAWQSPYLYALGSHSAKRTKIKSSSDQKDNQQLLEKVSLEPMRQQLLRIELNEKQQVVNIQSLSLQPLLQEHPILKDFVGLPSKENGIDMEGLSIDKQGRLYIGFRGPVLRGNIGTILRLETKRDAFEIKKSKLLYFNAQGRGVRGLSKADNGFLVLTGAVGDQPLSFQVYRWDGKNALSGTDYNARHFALLCEIPESKGKPEGVQFLRQTETYIDFVIVEDGVINGNPTTYRCPNPKQSALQ